MPRWFGIRWRIAAASTAAALVLLVGAGLIFLTTLRSDLQSNLNNSLRARSDELVAQLDAGGALRSGSGTGRLELADNSYGQVLTPAGAVALATGGRLPGPLITTAEARSVTGDGRYFDTDARSAGGHPQELRVLAVPVGTDGTIAVVASNRDIVDEAIGRAGKQLLILGTAVLLVVAPGSWLLARSALRPVERIRARAAALQAQDAAEGLPVPETDDEISRLATTLNELLARLHDALQRERAFVADAGHELRTPLTVLRGELELARRPGRTTAELQATVEVAAEETERLIRLSEDLLVLAREDAPDAGIPFDLTVVVTDACRRLQARAQVQGVGIEVRTPPRLDVIGNPDRIRQAVDNILTNALRYAPAGSSVEVIATTDATHARVTVLDHGPGFPPDVLPDIFERFRRADTSRSRSPNLGQDAGTGLGLAIARKIMRNHGGDARAANRAETGARVEIWWPTVPAGSPVDD